jgi:formate dehydrogenase subunit gamma
VLFIAMALAHIYIGTIGTERSYESMRTGFVDETWAKQHHEYWYNEAKAHQGHAPGGAPSTATASAMKEGWKL